MAGGLAEETTRTRAFRDHGNGQICENWNPGKGFLRIFGEGRRGGHSKCITTAAVLAAIERFGPAFKEPSGQKPTQWLRLGFTDLLNAVFSIPVRVLKRFFVRTFTFTRVSCRLAESSRAMPTRAAWGTTTTTRVRIRLSGSNPPGDAVVDPRATDPRANLSGSRGGPPSLYGRVRVRWLPSSTDL
ncbi:hypothetical protein BHE74_00035916 [Ensete ventricosum]|nr:hypothetical protein BHE74_00035916 [Ensete ventricosum]